MAPPELKSNFNRLVTVALQEYAARRKAQSFAEAMRRMAADPAIIKESSSIQREFLPAESDGLNE